MHLKVETDYAIRMVDYLIKRKGIAGAPEISEESKVPLRFAKNILQKLTKSEIVISYKGVYGGYELRKNPEELSLYDVVNVTDGPLILNQCMQRREECFYKSYEECPYYNIFMEISLELQNRMQGIKFSDLQYKNARASDNSSDF